MQSQSTQAKNLDSHKEVLVPDPENPTLMEWLTYLYRLMTTNCETSSGKSTLAKIISKCYILDPDDPDSCWGWRGFVHEPTHIAQYQNRSAARCLYTVLYGNPGPKFWIYSACGTQNCLKPQHLKLRTIQEAFRSSPKTNASKTACPRNHPYTEDNIYLDKKTNRRKCRICQRDWSMRYAKANRTKSSTTDLEG